MIDHVSVYMMLGATPAPNTDYYLGEATNIGAGQYQFNLPASTEDFKFYYQVLSKPGLQHSFYRFYNLKGRMKKLHSGFQFLYQ